MRNIYTLVFFLCSLWITAQSPGGISNIDVEIWLKADALNSNEQEEGTAVHLWQDLSGNKRDFWGILGTLPRFTKSGMNYHPAVEFYSINEEKGSDEDKKRKLVTQSIFKVDDKKSYFVIWVSKIDRDLSKGKATVFSLNASRDNNFGWEGSLWEEIATTSVNHQNDALDYGIGISIIPNKKNGAKNEFYFNGLSSLKNTADKQLKLSTDKKGVSVLGNSDDGNSTNNSFFGEIQEVIVLSRTSGETLSSTELIQLNSYLAIKYGISLELSGVQRLYMLSNNFIVYNIDSSGYTSFNKDIFGIARDNLSGLNQKQSINSNNHYMTVYVGNLEDTNNENVFELEDKTAVMFGGNGEIGVKPYEFGQGTRFINYEFGTVIDPVTGVIREEKVSSIYKYQYRAKVSGKESFTVNIAPNLGEWLLISKDAKFTPSTTRIYRIKGGKVENIQINDGDYIGFAYHVKAPGGVVDGLKMWLNASIANTITVNGSGEILNWSDYAGFGTSYKRKISNKSSALYVEADERTNFHPTALFRKWQDYLVTERAPFSVAAPANVAIYTVVNHSFANDRSYFIGFGSDVVNSKARRPSFGVYQNKESGFGRIGSTALTNSTKRLFTPKSTTIASYHWAIGTNIAFEFDAHSDIVRHTSKYVAMNEKGMLGLASSSKTYYLDGAMPEIIAYERALTQIEKNKINSYLGLKYGITIDLDKESINTNFNYVFSNNDPIWFGNDQIHKSYHNNVTSVLRDDNASLYNRQSKSTEYGSIVHMGVGTKLGMKPNLGNIIRDKSALTWGHNNLPMTEYSFAGNQDVCGAMDSRLNGRIWLVDNENFDQSILVSASGELFPYNGAGYQVFLLVADSASKLSANKWDQIVPMTFVDDKHVVNYKFKEKYSYFTFGAKGIGTCEGCDFQGIKSIDFTKKNWKRGDKGPKNFSLGDNFNVNITIEDPSNNLKPKYPRASSKKSLREKKSGSGVVTTKVVFKTDRGEKTAAATSFELFDVDRSGKVLDDVQVIGYCNGRTIYPKLTYTYKKPALSRYTINNIGGAVAKSPGVPGNGSSGYTNLRGRVFVDFEKPVEEIRIIYKTVSTASSNSSSFIGIGPMEFYCVAPPPPPNEDGLIFVKQGPTEAKLCEVVDYKFSVVNTNCAPKEVLFTDTLPEGMVWLNDSFSAGDIEVGDDKVYGYGTRTLVVSGLIVPGGGSTYMLRASAVFDENANPGIYKNRAALDYERLGKKVELLSQDRLTGNDFTETKVSDSPRPKQVVTSFTTDKSCFALSKEIEFTIEIENPNDIELKDMFLGIDYDSNSFKLVSGSLKTSNGLRLGSNQGEEGSLEYEDFTLPIGKSWIKYKVVASGNLTDYDKDIVTKKPINASFSFELNSESEDECLNSSLLFASGDIELPYCTVCYYKPVIGDNGDIFASDGFMALTTLNRPNMDWMDKRGNAFVVLESNNKGLVITRLTTNQISKLEAKEGMLVYDTTVNCIKLYNGKSWGCVEQGCVDE
ncbi:MULTISPECIES: hypothetical protein [unclassified Myroides]|uniref:hypothetical protein n=1 Tax=unclassified Myroides TaxID=2642485 RepID=UPI0031017DFC